MRTRKAAFILLCLSFFAYMIIRITKNFLGKNYYEIYAVVDNVSGLNVNSPVCIAGVNVGRVEKISLENGKAKLTMAIRPNIKVKVDAHLYVRSYGMLGTKYIDIVPGKSPEVIEPYGMVINTSPVVNVERLIERLSSIVNAIRGNLKEIVKHIKKISLNTNNITQRVNWHRQNKVKIQSIKERHGNTYINGLCLTHFLKKKKVYSIRADALNIRRGKLGFLSAGLFKTIDMKNVKIDFYGYEEGNFIDLGKYFSKIDPGPLIKSRRIKSISIQNAVINIYKRDRLISSILSEKVKIDPKNRKIIFKGNAKIVSQGRVLEANSFVWLPKRHMFKTDGACKFISEKGTIKGMKLEFDPLLKRIRGKNLKLKKLMFFDIDIIVE